MSLCSFYLPCMISDLLELVTMVGGTGILSSKAGIKLSSPHLVSSLEDVLSVFLCFWSQWNSVATS